MQALRRKRIFLSMVLVVLLRTDGLTAAEPIDKSWPKVAVIATAYYHNSHADVIATRLLKTNTLDGKGRRPKLRMASLYTDQVPENDISRRLQKEHGFPIYENVADALTLGTGKLAVDGVLLIVEHGDYEKSRFGQILYPKRRLFTEIVKVFRDSDRVVPVFIDKHLAPRWEDSLWIYQTAREMKIPLLAGSSIPHLWRYPPVNVPQGAKVKQIVATTYGPTEGYTFHALEGVQVLAERRQGGESGVRAMRIVEGEEILRAEKDGLFDRRLLQAALSRLKERPLRQGHDLDEMLGQAWLAVIDYHDGLRVCLFRFRRNVYEWTAAWRADRKLQSTVFWTQEARPYMHFTYLLDGIEQLVHTGKPPWPVERTLLTSGLLDAMMRIRAGAPPADLAHLKIRYQCDAKFQQPPPPPTGRPSRSQ